MNREQRRAAPKALAAKLGIGKKKLQEMLSEARARARAERDAKRTGASSLPAAEIVEPRTGDQADFDAEGGA